MNKRHIPFFKKTERWYNLSKGTNSILLPTDAAVRICRFEVHGNGIPAEDGSAIGVGDPTDNGAYALRLKLSGKNILNPRTFLEKHAANSGCLSSSETDGIYKFATNVSKNGNVIIDSSDIAFKPNTQYSFAGRFKNFIGRGTYRTSGLAFRYTDGTESAELYITSSANDYVACYTSDAGKTVAGIVTKVKAAATIGYYVDEFGFFEGVIESFDEFVPFEKDAELTVLLDTPLRSIGYSADILDLVGGSVRRRIASVAIDGSVTPEPCEDEGVFRIPLDIPREIGTPAICSVTALLPEDFDTAPTPSVLLPDESDCILLKTEHTDLELLMEYLTNTPIYLTYVKDSVTTEPLGIEIPYENCFCRLEIFSDVAPKKTFAVYN